MSLLRRLFKKKKRRKHYYNQYKEFEVYEAEVESYGPVEQIHVTNYAKDYVVNLCEQMIEISRTIDDVRGEYDKVTAQLNDIQIVEGLEGKQRAQLHEVANQVTKLIHARDMYIHAGSKISDETFEQIQEMEDELPAIIRRLMDNEKYLDTIKRDLNRLAAEKVEWSIIKQESEEEQNELRRLSKILLGVFGSAAILVAVLSIIMEWNSLPIIIVAFMATLAASYIIIRMQECATEVKQCEVNMNHAITLENRVKIRYVNTKNAIDYTCQRFHVMNAKELTNNYEQYIEVCKEREKFKQTNEDLEYFKNRLVRILKSLNLSDPKVWLNYANAIVEPKEMVEVKHELFTRRQGLRSRIEYNLNAIAEMRDDVYFYLDDMGDKSGQVRTILEKVEEINSGIL